MEGRLLLAGITFTVTSTDDSGPGTLRQAILDSNANPGTPTNPNTIDFSQLNPDLINPTTNSFLIQSTSPLPSITSTVTIDGYTAPGARRNTIVDPALGNNAVIKVELDGSIISSSLGGDGLLVQPLSIGATDSTVIEGLSVHSFLGHGIEVDFSGDVKVSGDFVHDNLDAGVYISGGSGSTIGGSNPEDRNMVSSNGSDGIEITNESTSNLVIGNVIEGNTVDGVLIGTLSDNNQVVGNTIEFNLVDGVLISTASDNNQVVGNTIRISINDGVLVNNSVGNTIGGATSDLRNAIYANGSNGVEIHGFFGGSHDNVVQGNYIGIDQNGNLRFNSPEVTIFGEPFPAFSNLTTSNLAAGVFLNGANANTIGGTALGAGNTISNNGSYGVEIFGTSATDNIVLGNKIGTDPTGMMSSRSGLSGTSYGNTLDGVFINLAVGNLIGTDGTTPPTLATANVIANNLRDGISITGSGPPTSTPPPLPNLIAGNLIGTNSNGDQSLGNLRNGIFIDSADYTRIGDPNLKFPTGGAMTPSNVISGNVAAGIEIDSASGIQVTGNFIGTTLNGEGRLGNSVAGVFLNNAGVDITHNVPGNTIGGEAPGKGNVISNHVAQPSSSSTAVGIQIFGTGSSGNFIQGNYIGTDASGTQDFGNTVGIFINFAPSNTIGGPTPQAGNVISGNDDSDVLVFGSGAAANVISRNIIGLNSADNAPLIGLANPNPDLSDPLDRNDPRTSVGVQVNQRSSLRSTIMTSRGTGSASRSLEMPPCPPTWHRTRQRTRQRFCGHYL